MAGIGMGVMHDAIHGSYSKNKRINTLLGYSFNLIGANATIWKIQHNVLHHTFTNIDHADDDLNAPFFLRFSPHAKHYWVHQFQHIYIWFFYMISTLSWITTKDFVRLKRFRDMGFLDKKNETIVLFLCIDITYDYVTFCMVDNFIGIFIYAFCNWNVGKYCFSDSTYYARERISTS